MIGGIRKFVGEHQVLIVVIITVLVIYFLYWWFCCKNKPLVTKVKGGSNFTHFPLLKLDDRTFLMVAVDSTDIMPDAFIKFVKGVYKLLKSAVTKNFLPGFLACVFAGYEEFDAESFKKTFKSGFIIGCYGTDNQIKRGAIGIGFFDYLRNFTLDFVKGWEEKELGVVEERINGFIKSFVASDLNIGLEDIVTDCIGASRGTMGTGSWDLEFYFGFCETDASSHEVFPWIKVGVKSADKVFDIGEEAQSHPELMTANMGLLNGFGFFASAHLLPSIIYISEKNGHDSFLKFLGNIFDCLRLLENDCHDYIMKRTRISLRCGKSAVELVKGGKKVLESWGRESEIVNTMRRLMGSGVCFVDSNSEVFLIDLPLSYPGRESFTLEEYEITINGLLWETMEEVWGKLESVSSEEIKGIWKTGGVTVGEQLFIYSRQVKDIKSNNKGGTKDVVFYRENLGVTIGPFTFKNNMVEYFRIPVGESVSYEMGCCLLRNHTKLKMYDGKPRNPVGGFSEPTSPQSTMTGVWSVVEIDDLTNYFIDNFRCLNDFEINSAFPRSLNGRSIDDCKKMMEVIYSFDIRGMNLANKWRKFVRDSIGYKRPGGKPPSLFYKPRTSIKRCATKSDSKCPGNIGVESTSKPFRFKFPPAQPQSPPAQPPNQNPLITRCDPSCGAQTVDPPEYTFYRQGVNTCSVCSLNNIIFDDDTNNFSNITRRTPPPNCFRGTIGTDAFVKFLMDKLTGQEIKYISTNYAINDLQIDNAFPCCLVLLTHKNSSAESTASHWVGARKKMGSVFIYDSLLYGPCNLQCYVNNTDNTYRDGLIKGIIMLTEKQCDDLKKKGIGNFVDIPKKYGDAMVENAFAESIKIAGELKQSPPPVVGTRGNSSKWDHYRPPSNRPLGRLQEHKATTKQQNSQQNSRPTEQATLQSPPNQQTSLKSLTTSVNRNDVPKIANIEGVKKSGRGFGSESLMSQIPQQQQPQPKFVQIPQQQQPQPKLLESDQIEERIERVPDQEVKRLAEQEVARLMQMQGFRANPRGFFEYLFGFLQVEEMEEIRRELGEPREPLNYEKIKCALLGKPRLLVKSPIREVSENDKKVEEEEEGE